MAVYTIYLHPPPKKPRSKRTQKPTRPKPSSGFQLLRNKEGVLYFRWPHDDGGSTKLVTYHIYPKGETYLRGRGISQDDGLPVSLALEIKDLGYLYTGKGGPKSREQAKNAASAGKSAGSLRSQAQSRSPKTHNQPMGKLSHRPVVESSRRDIRRVILYTPAAGMLAFRVRAVAGEPAFDSRPFRKSGARLALKSPVVTQILDEFLAELERQGWCECGRGGQWYERKLAKTVKAH